jgi:DNA repair protein RecN (Recombination protein N)
VEDEQNLIKQKTILLAQDKAKNIIGQVQALLSDGESFNILSSLKTCLNLLGQDPALAQEVIGPSLIKQLEEAQAIIADAAFELVKKIPEENDGSALEGVLSRLDAYQKLKTKLNASTADLVQRLTQFQDELNALANLEEELIKTQQELERGFAQLQTLGQKLHEQRCRAAQELSTQLTAKVRQLRMEGATLTLALTTDLPKASGISRLDFQAETNPGEGFFKVATIASGGELSRILLAFRQVLATTDNISIFFFDEIDSGIGGITATSVGEALSEVAAQTQVLAITHLPQLAQFAQRLLEVHKSTLAGAHGQKTISQVQEIWGDQIPHSLQKMTPLRAELSSSP